MVASASSVAIGGAAAIAGSAGNVSSQPPPAIARRAAAPRPPHNANDQFMMTCSSGQLVAWRNLPRAERLRNDVNQAETVMEPREGGDIVTSRSARILVSSIA